MSLDDEIAALLRDESLGGELSDEEWDALGDREADAAAELSWTPPMHGPLPPPEPWFRWPRLAREYDRQLAVLAPDTVGEFVRACRASAGLSQRAVADTASVPQSTVARIESGRNEDVRLSTVARLAEACGVMLVGTTAGYVSGGEVPLVESDHAQRHRDRGDRWLPAHRFNRPRQRWDGSIVGGREIEPTLLRDVPDD